MININCNLCGAGAPSKLYETPDGRTINRCTSCGFVYVNPVPEISEIEKSHEHGCYEVYGEKYETLLEKKIKEWRELFATLATLAQPGPLLDVGCGRGYCSALARQLGWQPTGVDIAREDIDFATQTHGLTVLKGPLSALSLESNSFNAAIMWSLIEHLHDPAAELAETLKLLKPGGVISVSTCNVESKAAHDAGAQWEYFRFEGHLTFFSPETLAAMMERTGYEVLEVSGGVEFASEGMNKLKRIARAGLSKALPPSMFSKVKKLAAGAASAAGPTHRAGENFIAYARKPNR